MSSAPVHEAQQSPDSQYVANNNSYAAGSRWSVASRGREDANGGQEHSPPKLSRRDQTVQNQQYKSYSPELKDLFRVDYDLKAPFEENIRMLNHRKRNKKENRLRVGSDGPSPKRRRTPNRNQKIKGNEKAVAVVLPIGTSMRQTQGLDKAPTAGQPVSQTPLSATNIQSNMEKAHPFSLPMRPASPSPCIASSIDAYQRESQRANISIHGAANLATNTTNNATKAAEAAFNPPKAPRSHLLPKDSPLYVQRKETDSDTMSGTFPQNAASNEHGHRPAKVDIKGCKCNLPSFFTAQHHRIPNLNHWTGKKEEFLVHIRNISNCKSHPSQVRGACRRMIKLHEASTARGNEVELFRATDLERGIFSDRNGRWKVDRGRSQSTIGPHSFYNSLRNANVGKPADGLSSKKESFDISQEPRRRITPSMSPDRVSKVSPSIFDSEQPVDHICGSHPKTTSGIIASESAAEKDAQDVIDWAAHCLEQEMASISNQQSPTRDVSPSERSHIQENSGNPIDMSPSKHFPSISLKRKRYQSLPARLSTPAPHSTQVPESSGDRIKGLALQHLEKVPNLSMVDIKRVVEQLDRRLTDIEARSIRSSDRPGIFPAPTIIHYSTRQGFTNVPSATTPRASSNTSSSALTAPQINGFTPINQPVPILRNAVVDSNAMPPPPVPPKRKKKSIAEQKLEKPELSPDVPGHERLPEADIIDLGRRKVAYNRHESAPYAFNYRGKLRKEYRHLLTKVGTDGKTVWIAEEVARLS